MLSKDQFIVLKCVWWLVIFGKNWKGKWQKNHWIKCFYFKAIGMDGFLTMYQVVLDLSIIFDNLHSLSLCASLSQADPQIIHSLSFEIERLYEFTPCRTDPLFTLSSWPGYCSLILNNAPYAEPAFKLPSCVHELPEPELMDENDRCNDCLFASSSERYGCVGRSWMYCVIRNEEDKRLWPWKGEGR